MAYDNSNSGFLSRNERKNTEKHPDYTGTCEVGGVPYWISGWTKEGKPGSKMAGKKFFSLSFKAKDDQQRQSAPAQSSSNPPPVAQAGSDNIEEDPPF